MYTKGLVCSFVVICFLVCCTLPASGQKSKSQLENEKKENLRKIKEANRILSETESARKVSIGQLNAINKKTEATRGLIGNIKTEMNFLSAEIREISMVIESMEKDLEALKEEYAAMVYAAYKTHNNINKLSFLFSAKSFNQLLMRLKYMEQYKDARKSQVEEIQKVKAGLVLQKAASEDKKTEKQLLLQRQEVENKNLTSLQKEQKKVISSLSQKQKELKAELNRRKKAIQKLDRLIAALIEKEMRKNTVSKASGKIKLTPEAAKLSSSFAENKARLPWPVASGFISQKFGTHAHPVLKGIKIDNQGVDIQTKRNEKVRTVFKGKVTAVAVVPGMNNVVIVQHGEYHTVYARLKKVYVKTGQSIQAKEAIGEVYTDKDGISELQFQVWKNNKKTNPEHWLYMK